jgi:hypothetical protein
MIVKILRFSQGIAMEEIIKGWFMKAPGEAPQGLA